MAARLPAIDPNTAQGKAKELLNAVQSKLGLTPNMMRTMAVSPTVLEGYLALSGALEKGQLGAKCREQLALAVAEADGCSYCASAHTALGKLAGLTAQQADSARRCEGIDAKATAALRLARAIIEKRGNVSDEELRSAHNSGLGEPEIAEVAAHVALNIFTNYFNQLAATEIDFPRVEVERR